MPANEKLFERIGYSIGIGTFLFSTLFFYYYSDEFYYSFLGALLSALMVWLSYIIIRLLYIASR